MFFVFFLVFLFWCLLEIFFGSPFAFPYSFWTCSKLFLFLQFQNVNYSLRISCISFNKFKLSSQAILIIEMFIRFRCSIKLELYFLLEYYEQNINSFFDLISSKRLLFTLKSGNEWYVLIQCSFCFNLSISISNFNIVSFQLIRRATKSRVDFVCGAKRVKVKMLEFVPLGQVCFFSCPTKIKV